jgi:hypothetical protein
VDYGRQDVKYSCTGIEEKAGENPRSEIENAGYYVARWFADDAATGLIPRTKEQQFTAMMHHLIAGDTLVVSKLLHLLVETPKTSWLRFKRWRLDRSMSLFYN